EGIARNISDEIQLLDDRYRQLFTNAAIGATYLTLDGVIIEANHAYHKMLGYEDGELNGRSVMDVTHPDDVELTRNWWKDVVTKDDDYHQIEKRFIDKQGSLIWGRVSSTAIRDADGQPVKIIGQVENITEKKTADELLRANEAEYRAIIDTAVDAIIMIDENGLIEKANNAATDLLGFETKELIGQNVSMLMPEPDQSNHDGYLDRYKKGGESKIIGIGREVLARHKDGSIVPVHLAVSEISVPGRRLYTGILRDLSGVKAAYAALEQYAEVLEKVDVGIVVWSSDKRLILCNGTFRAQLGELGATLKSGDNYEDYTRALAERRKAHGVLDCDVDTWIENRLCELEGNLPPTDFKIIDGRWLKIVRQKLADGGTISIHIDITETKKIEAGLLESEERARAFLNATSDAAALATVTGEIVDLNQAMAGRFGKNREDIIGMNMADIGVPGDVLGGRLDIRRRVVTTGKAAKMIEQREGLWLENTYYPVFGEGNEVKYIAVFSRDITIEANQKQLEQSRLRLLDSINKLPIGFILWDAEDKFVMCNDNFQNLYGPSGRFLETGVHISDYFYAIANSGLIGNLDGSTENWVKYALLRHNQETSSREMKQNDGRWTRIHKQRLADKSVIAFHFDITELKRSQLEAELANSVKSDFLANMSHELRTPLNAVIGYSDALMNEIFGPLANDKQLDYVESIHGSGHHLLSLIEDVLDVSAIEAGKLELHSEEFGLDDILDAVTNMISIRAKDGNVSIVNSCERSLPKMYADQRRVKQILVNLLSNAVKFTPPGGNVTLSGKVSENGELAIAIADTGIGMSRSDIDLAMETFGRVKSKNRELEAEGTGLGLPMVKGLIEMHGGRLEIDSELGVGTTARIVFPRDRVARAG
ncbi:MAG: PAS domain S-box protein, partial [Rhodospirillales bacterium]|nr:PAS domain S-box protein [Rhodospirillales bacterium]